METKIYKSLRTNSVREKESNWLVLNPLMSKACISSIGALWWLRTRVQRGCLFSLAADTHVLLLLNAFIFSWRTIALQYCAGFCHTAARIRHRFTYAPSLFAEDTLALISRCAGTLLDHTSGISHYDSEQGFKHSLASSQRYTVQASVRRVFLVLFRCTVKPRASVSRLSPVDFLQPKISFNLNGFLWLYSFHFFLLSLALSSVYPHLKLC